jgi:hypothetical protein
VSTTTMVRLDTRPPSHVEERRPNDRPTAVCGHASFPSASVTGNTDQYVSPYVVLRMSPP